MELDQRTTFANDVRSWRKLTCDRRREVRVLMWWTAPAPGIDVP